MNSSAARKEATRKFKEQKVQRGVFLIRCLRTAEVWIGSSRNLSATKNGTWFGLRIGSHMDKLLQKRWNEHGEESFRYEVLEVLVEGTLPALRHGVSGTRGYP
jgi:hypothetical protein